MSKTTAPPTFRHPEILALYEHDLKIPREKVETILALPRETLVADLRAVLEDSVTRYEYFKDREWNENEMEFLLHALWLLTDLREPGTITDVLRLLRQDQERLDFWFMDILIDDLWQVVFVLGQNALDELKRFVLDTDVYMYVKSTVARAVAQMALHDPERAEEVADWFRQVFEHYLTLPEDDPELETELISFLVNDAALLHSAALLPVIRRLYDRELVFNGICSDYDSIEREIQDIPPDRDRHRVHNNIFERYQDALTTWHYYREKYDENYRKKTASFSSPRQETIKRDQPKVGRNDPCPCGSGKKYKKCCWGK
jgi:hypothetical protein